MPKSNAERYKKFIDKQRRFGSTKVGVFFSQSEKEMLKRAVKAGGFSSMDEFINTTVRKECERLGFDLAAIAQELRDKEQEWISDK